MWPVFVPFFQGIMWCKNGPKLLKVNIYCMLWPNNVCKLFCITIFYELFLVKQIFNIFNCHCALFDEVLFPFRGSCCVKITKCYTKSTFLECFDLITSGFFVLHYFMISVKSSTFSPCFGPLGGNLCKNGPKLLKINIYCMF